ncbi:ABC transporter permease [Mycoplasma elephantis]|uniref:ABC transporter permease n=1 Tax=Mycoplasma elephantis TaxID=114882 RepID=UPI000487AB94|nr:ABC transporter permease [Mycoplasma elephantis]
MDIIFISSVTFIIILALAAFSGSIIERSGTTNLSIDGFMIFGGLNYALIANTLKNTLPVNQTWIFLLSGIIPMIFGLVYAFLTVTLKADQTIAGIALNTLAIAVTLFIITTKINPGYEESTQYINVFNGVWRYGAGQDDFRTIINIASIMGIVIIGLLILMLNKTKLGIKIKTVGENPQAAASLGIDVIKTRYIAILISSYFTGIAGALFFQYSGVTFNGNTKGVGFLAVAMVIFGQWRPTYIILSSIFFGFIYTFAENILLTPLVGVVNAELFRIIPYAITIFVLVFTQRNSKSPKALGIPFETQGR